MNDIRMRCDCQCGNKMSIYESELKSAMGQWVCSQCNSRNVIDYSELLMISEKPDNADPVNHPSHYAETVPGIECIDVTKHFSFRRGNAIKYIWRAGNKDKAKTAEDLKKAVWYLNHEIAELEGEK